VRRIAAIALCLLAGCASAPQRVSPLAVRIYALRGQLVSELSQHRISANMAAQLSEQLTEAEADLGAGDATRAQTLATTVSEALGAFR
jgi:hypothetical protein